MAESSAFSMTCQVRKQVSTIVTSLHNRKVAVHQGDLIALIKIEQVQVGLNAHVLAHVPPEFQSLLQGPATMDTWPDQGGPAHVAPVPPSSTSTDARQPVSNQKEVKAKTRRAATSIFKYAAILFKSARDPVK